MDMLPPQAPPAHTQAIYQQAEQAFDRVVALQGWLATEHAALPGMPADASLTTFLGALDGYWNAAPSQVSTDPSRRQAVATRVAAAARDLATLAHEDGTMDTSLRDLARAVTAPGGTLPASLRVHEALFAGVPYAGVLLVQDATQGERVLAFFTDHGWETFDDLAAARQALESRARAALVTSADLPGIARQHLTNLDATPFVGTRPVDGDAFATLVDRLVAMQKDKLAQAWFEAGLDSDARRATDRADAVADILASDRIFDAAAALAARQERLAEAISEQRLARVPANVADDWRQAKDDYVTLQQSIARRATQGYAAPVMGLAAFTRHVLDERLRALGVTQSAADIAIDIENYHRFLPQAVVDLFADAKPPSMTLVDLAYRNIGTDDPVRLTATDTQGGVIAALDDATLRRLVREANVHVRYPAYVDLELRTGSNAPDRRDPVSVLQRARMRLLANEARLSYYLDGEPRSFRRERTERGFRWVEAVLDAPTLAARARVEGHAIHVSQLTYRGAPLRDVLLIGARDPRSVPSVVLYTPDAPDGITFREFNDRQEAGRKFLYDPAFSDYLLDRLPMDHAVVRSNGTRAFAGDRLANWVLGSGDTGNYTFTAEPFAERHVEGDVFATLYETDTQLGLYNARALTTGTDDAQSRWIDEYQRKMVANVARVVVDVVTAPIHSAAAGWRLYDSVKAGDTTQSFVDFTQFYVASLWAAPGVHHFARTGMGRGLVAGRFRAAGTLVDARAAAPQKVVFESKYAAQGVRKAGRASDEGIYTIGDARYIEHDGKLYGVRFDTDYGTWRLARPQSGPGGWGPAIERTAMGHWAFHRVGLRGGSGRGAAGGRSRQVDTFDEFVDEAERAFPDPVERERVMGQMRRELTENIPATITGEQRARWAAACERARMRAPNRLPLMDSVPRSVGQDLTTAPLPPGIRRVPDAEVPSTLYFYDRLPFKNSRLIRSIYRPNEGYSNNSGSIRVQMIADGMPGVRATTVAPDAPVAQIETAMGFAPRSVARKQSFSVEFRTRELTQTMPDQTAPKVHVYAPTNGPAGTYYLVPVDGSDEIRINFFDVQKYLPGGGAH
nr:DUF6543 domain-containing protein [Luteibacter sp. UNCMF331Sha3.1]